METAVKALGWNKNQLYELIQELDPNHNGDITYEEFVLIMKYIEQKQLFKII
jgi:Ca2+-binding EF-hand superfamily protein